MLLALLEPARAGVAPAQRAAGLSALLPNATAAGLAAARAIDHTALSPRGKRLLATQSGEQRDDGKGAAAWAVRSIRGLPRTLVLAVASSDEDVLTRVADNVKAQPELDFAAILYKGNATDWDPLREELRTEFNRSLRVRQGELPDGVDPSDPGFVPKFWFQAQARDWAEDYEYVWMVDEDISFAEFDARKFFRRHKAFPTGPPLVAQPTIAEDTQSRESLANHGAWPDGTMAAVTNYVEQQTPILDAAFWRWLTGQTEALRAKQVEKRSDWGLDLSWCAAAAFYAASEPPRLLSPDAAGQRTACGIINVPISHQDSRSIGWQLDTTFWIRGAELMDWACHEDDFGSRFAAREGYWPPRATQVFPPALDVPVPYPEEVGNAFDFKKHGGCGGAVKEAMQKLRRGLRRNAAPGR